VDREQGTWKLEFTPEARRWYLGLDDKQAASIAAALDRLEQAGPNQGRPDVDSIKSSRHHNMKELRSFGKNLRALFVFDHRRHGVVLLGGDKTNDWRGWYERNIPKADRLYDRHLRDTGRNTPWPVLRAGRKFESRGR
jgi:hypothetical protein